MVSVLFRDLFHRPNVRQSHLGANISDAVWLASISDGAFEPALCQSPCPDSREPIQRVANLLVSDLALEYANIAAIGLLISTARYLAESACQARTNLG
jgi:hypothetical protein